MASVLVSIRKNSKIYSLIFDGVLTFLQSKFHLLTQKYGFQLSPLLLGSTVPYFLIIRHILLINTHSLTRHHGAKRSAECHMVANL